ncbi:hypothetical protein SARC_07048 [Sphaeroforma arctica JP610]|uniref:Uncharacterized protein n=1 Tax=Sphaeroforma arctica JP610 TaxID=667725 RepID=A0A0L0FVF0_9EUKA|nr:hypothetical protein SARC_07048 [Sphaeroforma arctica JP610]KNC80594.1 hypothetical protein SARC_07048 [Sphaeroforma arctica JP610]|eukprot:XP_014154496.1 hypothetical protein SARC_07048 [Sphaeroforma arctica JP610]
MTTRKKGRKDDGPDGDDQRLHGMRETDTSVDEILESDKKIADFTARMLNAEEDATLAMDQGRINQASLRMTIAKHFQSKIDTELRIVYAEKTVNSKKFVKDIGVT